tara:strand:+ start:246 stop:383 length:138 start_codon:yes stop_codon:yes gene_type:complete
VEDARKEYKKLLEEDWKKANIFKIYFQNLLNSNVNSIRKKIFLMD